MAEPTDAQINAALYLLKRVREDPIARLKMLALIAAAGNAKRGNMQ